MSTTFTPGPWTAQLPKTDETQIRIVDNRALKYSNSRLADLSYWEDSPRGPNRSEAFANARLIAAAPDLYEACKTFAAWLDREEHGFDFMTHDRSTSEGEAAWREWYDTNITLCGMAQELVRAALAKAEGKQS